MEQPITPSVFEQEQKPVYFAGTGQRLANYIIDTIAAYIFGIVFFIILAFVLALINQDAVNFLIEETVLSKLTKYILFAALFLSYYTLLEGTTKGKTLGKLITGTKAVQEDGDVITWGDAFKRSLCRLIPFEAFSGLGGNPWHDSMTKTTVVKKS